MEVVIRRTRKDITERKSTKETAMTRIEKYNRMKELGVKHYIVSCCHLTEDGQKCWFKDSGFISCHYTDEEFEREIARLERQGYNMFDVIHLH